MEMDHERQHLDVKIRWNLPEHHGRTGECDENLESAKEK